MDEAIQVLHVDDDRALANLVAIYLEQERPDLEVTSVSHAEAALEELDDTCRFGCVVTDYDMPGMNGVELLETIRAKDPDIPVILYTGKGSEEVASKAVSAGVTEYMQKESSPEQYVVLANRIYNVATAYRTSRELRETRERYRRLVENAPNAILVVSDGRVVFANETATNWSSHSSLTGVPVERLVQSRSLPDFRASLRTALGRGEAVDWRRGWLHDALGGLAVEYTAVTVSHDGGDAVQLVFRDVSDRIERARTLEALLDATADLIEADSTQRVYEVVAETATEVLALPHAAVWEYDADEAALVPVAYPDVPELPDEAPTFREGTSLSWDAFAAGETRVYDDLRDLPTHNEATTIRSEVIVPIGRFGVLNAGSTVRTTFPEQAVSLAEVLANTAAAILGSRQLDR